MLQLELKLSGFDLPKVIEHFEKHETMYRWYPSEIANRISKITNDQGLMEHFKKRPNQLWYLDEIVAELKKLNGI